MDRCENRSCALFDVLEKDSGSQSQYQGDATMAETMGEVRVMLLYPVVSVLWRTFTVVQKFSSEEFWGPEVKMTLLYVWSSPQICLEVSSMYVLLESALLVSSAVSDKKWVCNIFMWSEWNYFLKISDFHHFIIKWYFDLAVNIKRKRERDGEREIYERDIDGKVSVMYNSLTDYLSF